MNKTFCVLIYQWSISLTLAVLQRQKSLPDIGGTTYRSRCRLPSCHGTRQASTPWAMSLYFKFRAIYFWLLNEYQWWHQAKIYHMIRQPSVHVWNHDLIWWQNKIDTQKTFPQDYDYELLNLSKTKIPITIVKAQMPSNPNQKSRTQDNNW